MIGFGSDEGERKKEADRPPLVFIGLYSILNEILAPRAIKGFDPKKNKNKKKHSRSIYNLTGKKASSSRNKGKKDRNQATYLLSLWGVISDYPRGYLRPFSPSRW